MADTEELAIVRERLDVFRYGGYEFSPSSLPLVSKLLDDLIQITESCKEKDLQLRSVTSDKDQYYNFIRSFDKELESFHGHIKQITSEREELRTRLEETEAELAKYQQTDEKDKEIERLRTMVEELDADRDTLQHELDTVRDEGDKVQQQLSQAQQNLSEFKTAVDVERGKGGELQQALQDKDKEIFSLKKQLTKANEIQRSLEIQHQNLVVELTKLSSDQNNLLQENQVLMKEKAMQGKLLSEIRTKAEAVSTINVHFEQRLKNLDQEKSDILNAYQDLGKEHEKLLENHQNTLQQTQELNAAVKERDIELKRALEYIEDVEQQNANYVKELRSFELQITTITMQLHDKTQEVTALNNQQRSILEDLKAEKALSETHQTALMAIRNEVAQLHREGDYLRQQVKDIHIQKDAFAAQLDKEHSRCKQLEDLLKIERVNGFDLQSKLAQQQQHQRQLQAATTPTSSTNGTYVNNGTNDTPCDHSQFERTIEEQKKQIRILEKERDRLQRFHFKYESELAKQENKVLHLNSTIRRLETELSNSSISSTSSLNSTGLNSTGNDITTDVTDDVSFDHYLRTST